MNKRKLSGDDRFEEWLFECTTNKDNSDIDWIEDYEENYRDCQESYIVYLKSYNRRYSYLEKKARAGLKSAGKSVDVWKAELITDEQIANSLIDGEYSKRESHFINSFSGELLDFDYEVYKRLEDNITIIKGIKLVKNANSIIRELKHKNQ